MQPLALDFRRRYRRVPWAGLLVLALAATAVAGIGFQYMDANEQLAVAEARLKAGERSSRRQQAALYGTAADLQKVALEIKRANEIIVQLNLPWDALFKAMESFDKKQVALLSVEPDPQKRRVKVTAEAKSFAAMLSYTRHLQRQELLRDIFLQSHQVQQQDPEKPVRFVFTAEWVTRR